MNQNIEHEEEYLAGLFNKYKDLKEHYGQERFVEFLREIQDTYGYIPTDVQESACQEFGIKLSVVRSILKFFPSLHAVVRHRIVLCTGPSCTAKESAKLSLIIEAELKKKREHKKGVYYSFVTQNCMKHCRTAVNIQIDGEHFPNMTEPELRKRLDQL